MKRPQQTEVEQAMATRPQDGPVTAKHVSENVNYYLRVKCGLPHRLHSLRKRVATAALRDTGDLRMVQELLGHANLSTLHVYTGVQRGDMAAAVARLPRPPASVASGGAAGRCS